ncbi:SRPBCC family protein [Arthrobacter sp. QXT-31]|uniref:SRPBCC family protein n=1 Tax=Arthrobacter sp. QXT-31 TaxID=1357915 RepID=UPI0009FAD9A4|nr:SRPBCC family protein [Arthrobacter sp. QXT-31]
MLIFEATELVAASPASLLGVLTDASNLEVWDSGMVHRDGDVRDGSHVTVSSSDGQHHCTFTVQLAAESAMTWSHSLGFFRATRTWTLTPADGGTLLLVTDQFRGPLSGQLRQRVPLAGSSADLERYLQAVKARAELLQRTPETR